MRDILLIIHILATCLWIGANVVGLIVNPRINRHASAIASEPWYLALVRTKRYLYPPVYLIILITGVLLVIAVEDSPYKLTDAFNVIGFLAVLVGAWLGMIYFERQGPRVGAAFAAGDMQTAESIKRKIAIGQFADMAIVVLATVAMVSTWRV
jgi:uncharacterized membrane protein